MVMRTGSEIVKKNNVNKFSGERELDRFRKIQILNFIYFIFNLSFEQLNEGYSFPNTNNIKDQVLGCFEMQR